MSSWLKNTGREHHQYKLKSERLCESVEAATRKLAIEKTNIDQYKNKLKRRPLPKKCMGVFCDTAFYANFIKSSLQILEIEIKHFAPPATFTSTEYSSYDEISAWIVFVSDGGDFHFIDRFVDRYVDKPTLFICPQTSIVKTSEKINQFVAETKLFNLNTERAFSNKIELT